MKATGQGIQWRLSCLAAGLICGGTAIAAETPAAGDRLARRLEEVDALIRRSKALLASTPATSSPASTNTPGLVAGTMSPAAVDGPEAGQSSPTVPMPAPQPSQTGQVERRTPVGIRRSATGLLRPAPPEPGSKRHDAYQRRALEEEAFNDEVLRREQEITSMYALAASIQPQPLQCRIIRACEVEPWDGTPPDIRNDVFVDGVYRPIQAGGEESHQRRPGPGGSFLKYIADTPSKYIADGGPIRVDKREIPIIWTARPLVSSALKPLGPDKQMIPQLQPPRLMLRAPAR